MSDLSDLSLKVAALAAIAALVDDEYKKARRAAEEAFKANGIKSLTINLPDGEEVGGITVTSPSASVSYDEDALLAWAAEHTPAEVEEYLDASVQLDQEAIEWARAHRDDLLRRRIRQVWRKELDKQAKGNGGYVIDTATGETAKVAEVTPNRSTGAFSLSPDRHGERAARLITALRSGELAGVTALAISPVEEAGDAPQPS